MIVTVLVFIVIPIDILAHAGINLSNSPRFSRNGGAIHNLGDYVDYYSYLKRNHLLEEMLDDDWSRFKLLGRKFMVTIPRKQPRNGASVYAGSVRLTRPGMCREGR